MTGRGMDDKARGFVQDKNGGIFEEDIKIHLFGMVQ